MAVNIDLRHKVLDEEYFLKARKICEIKGIKYLKQDKSKCVIFEEGFKFVNSDPIIKIKYVVGGSRVNTHQLVDIEFKKEQVFCQENMSHKRVVYCYNPGKWEKYFEKMYKNACNLETRMRNKIKKNYV